ncbi:hypothetical protein BTN82_17985 [Pseudomonas chlororaphis]|uniref:Uncharacterized protein n=1 Tax=Pseudomonas chlororaphis TaxID=587753 RepID=A0A1Q8EMZ0_9PSED|nr:hypothetical protein BTN82_17985 [Pseudomonas chlororaphis]
MYSSRIFLTIAASQPSLRRTAFNRVILHREQARSYTKQTAYAPVGASLLAMAAPPNARHTASSFIASKLRSYNKQTAYVPVGASLLAMAAPPNVWHTASSFIASTLRSSVQAICAR